MGKNIIANIIGKFWGVFSVFIFVPLYIKILGFESYTLISFTLIIAGLLAFLDSGLTSTLSREMARKDVDLYEKTLTFKTFESIYLMIILFVIGLIFFSSTEITNNWIHVKQNPEKVSYYLKIVSFDIALQLYFRFNLGGLLGLEKQIKANVIQVSWGVLRNGIVVVAIVFYPTLEMFFIWQTTSTLIFCFITKYLLKKELSMDSRLTWKPIINKEVLQKNYKFAVGMLLISVVAGINTQIDKFIISKNISLTELGYYTLATSLGIGIISVISPISVATLPRFTALYSEGKKEETIKLFNSMNLLVSVISFSLMSTMIIFPKEILWIWTGNLSLANQAKIFLPYMAIAYTTLCIVYIPFNIAVANGYTKINNYLGVISLLITVPGYYYLSKQYGALGVVILFCAVQILSNTIYFALINKKFLHTKLIRTLLKTVLIPLILSLSITFLLSLFHVIQYENRILSLLWIGFVTIITFVISAFTLINHPLIDKIKLKMNLK
jgi:O-antigen/teichoic acid export membrane protein